MAVVGGSPSGVWRDAGWVWGVMDVVFLDGQLAMGPDSVEAVATDLAYPVALAFAPGGAVSVATPTFGPDAGEGLGGIVQPDLSGSTSIFVAGLESAVSSC